LITIAYKALNSEKGFGNVFGGVMLGATACLRPPLSLLVIPFVVFGNWRVVGGFLAGVLVGVLYTVLLFDPHSWVSYHSAMKVFGPIEYAWYTWPEDVYPSVIEGMANIQENRFGAPDTSVLYFFNRILNRNIAHLLPLIIIFLTAIATGILVMLRRRNLTAAEKVLAGLFFVVTADFLLPASRHVYQDVIWLVVFSIIIKHLNWLEALKPWFWIVTICSALMLSVGVSWFPARPVLMELALYVSFVAAVCKILWNARSRIAVT
jgi:hypothetical protein